MGQAIAIMFSGAPGFCRFVNKDSVNDDERVHFDNTVNDDEHVSFDIAGYNGCVGFGGRCPLPRVPPPDTDRRCQVGLSLVDYIMSQNVNPVD